MTSEASFPLHPSERRETEVQRLVREIAERQARLSELVLGDPPVKEISFAELLTIIECFTKGYAVKRATTDIPS
jgi:hypothetical protein